LAGDDALDAGVRHHCGQLLPLLELLPPGAVPILVPQAQVRFRPSDNSGKGSEAQQALTLA